MRALYWMILAIPLAVGCGPTIHKGVVVANDETQRALTSHRGLYKPSEWTADGAAASPRNVILMFDHAPPQLHQIVDDPRECRKSVIASAPSSVAPAGFLVGVCKKRFEGDKLRVEGKHVPLSAAIKRGGIDLSLVVTEDGLLPKDSKTGAAVEVRKGVVPLNSRWFAKKGHWEQAAPVRMPGPVRPKLPKLNVDSSLQKLKPLGHRLDSSNGCHFQFDEPTKTLLGALRGNEYVAQLLHLEGPIPSGNTAALDALAGRANLTGLLAEDTPKVGLALGLGLVASQVDLSLFPSRKSKGKGALKIKPVFRMGRTIHSASSSCATSGTDYMGAQVDFAETIRSHIDPQLASFAQYIHLGFELECEYSPTAPLVKPLVVWVGPLPVVLVPRIRTRFKTLGKITSADVCMGPIDGVEMDPVYSHSLRKKPDMNVSFAGSEPAVFDQVDLEGELSVGADANFLVGIYDLAGPQVTGGVTVTAIGGGFGVPTKLNKTAYLEPGFGAGRLLWWTGWGTEWPDQPQSGEPKRTRPEKIEVRKTPSTSN